MPAVDAITRPKSPPRVDATARLLLLLARETLDEGQTATARTLIPEIADWPEFLHYANWNRSIGFVHKHLTAIAPNLAPPDVLETTKAIARRMAMDQMALTAAMLRFHRDCVAPSSARYVYIKGPALAADYYAQPVVRPCSDIDILVSSADYAAVARNALANGYRFLFPSDPPTFATAESDLDFMIRHSDVILCYDPDGRLFEIHRHIEKTTPIFPEDELLAAAKPVRLGDCDVATLPLAWHFVYVCYHHSRHFWSRLHWVADLHAMRAHPAFDRAEIVALAKSIGLSATVEAALEFATLTDTPSAWPNAIGATPAGTFLDACLRGLPGDSAFEVEGWKEMFLFDFANPWQFDQSRKYEFWARSALRRLQPECSQYARYRLPRLLEWVYCLENAIHLFGNALRRMTGRRGLP